MATEEMADIFSPSHPMHQQITSGSGTPLMSEKLVVSKSVATTFRAFGDCGVTPHHLINHRS
jgi:hypothetical protein